ncbi:MAG: hypothetical protein OXF23_01345 [Candidatus Dadabacteria bacterium]|nr:hypothetical protein [Candidatus Dadabacteria bacterium]MCY4262295.1 hypothetical protein [Candidatus Dadabacteria bacterium]
MGLVNEIRDRRDSWSRRLEEQRVSREPYNHKFEKQNARRIEEEIKRNQEMVGKFRPAKELPE